MQTPDPIDGGDFELDTLLPLHAQRVSVRRLRARDLAAFQAYRKDPAVGALQGWLSQSDDEAHAFLREMAVARLEENGEWFQLGIAETKGDMLIGDIGLCLRRGKLRHAELGFSLSRDAQGRGLAHEAIGLMCELLLTRVRLDAVRAITDERNGAARKLLEKLGFRHTATTGAIYREAPCVEFTFELTEATRQRE